MDRSDLLNAGGHLANCAFNLAQSPRLTDDERRSLDESRKAWDVAVVAAPPPPAQQASGGWESLRQWWWQRTEYMEPGAAEMVRELLRSIAALSQRPEVTVDYLAQAIRVVDGRHALGAAALAEALMPFLAPQQPEKGEG